MSTTGTKDVTGAGYPQSIDHSTVLVYDFSDNPAKTEEDLYFNGN